MNINKIALYIKDNNGKIRVWAIGVEDWTIVIDHGELNGSMQRTTEDVPEGLAGRTREDQIMSRVASRISKQRDKGYSPDIRVAQSGEKPRNTLGFAKPMLATPLKNVKGVDYKGAYIQRKYDGNRCLITNEGGELVAYTRNGKRIETINHILDGLELLDGQTIDGELYAHGYPLQTIVSWIKRKQADTLKIRYHVYDVIADLPYSRRYALLNMIPLTDAMELVPTEEVRDWDHVQEHFNESRKKGYEGSIVRLHTHGYEDGKRSKSLIKIKSWEDRYFEIRNIIPSREGWAILECGIDPGDVTNKKTFRVTCPGPMDHKQYVMDNKERYIGCHVRVEFAQLTKDGVPFHPVATLIIEEGDL